MKSSSVIIAVKTDNNKKLKALIEEKADVNTTDADGVSALTWAAQIGLRDVVKTLLENKANVNYADNAALTMAMRYRNSDIVELLKADTSTQPKKNETTDNKFNKDSINTLSFSLARMLKDTEKQLLSYQEEKRKKNPEAAKDLANMFAHLLDLDDTEEFDNVDYNITSGKSYRTIKAHYRHTDPRVKRAEKICRTTITAPEFPVK
jgi:ankyrin repeat protein